MARYDDWVYDRGLENESWVHDRWGDDDDDDWDDFEEDLEEGEEFMEQNRITFKRNNYTELEKIVIKTQIDRVLAKLASIGVGTSVFKLNEEVMAIYNQKGKLSFKLKDEPESFDTYDRTFYSGNYYNLVLFLIKWKDIEGDLNYEKDYFERKEKEMLSIPFTREDGVDRICTAIENGANIDISKIFDLENLTQEEKKWFVEYGYGYDLYDEGNNDKDAFELNELIKNKLKNLKVKLNDWIENNPDKCLISSNRK